MVNHILNDRQPLTARMNAMFKKYFQIYVVLLFFGVFISTSPVAAYDINTIQKMPTGEALPYDGFVQSANIYKKQPLGLQYLSYEVTVPKDWQDSYKEEADIDDINGAFMTDLGRFVSPAYGDTRAVVTIEAMKLRHELFVQDWFREKALSQSYNVKVLDIKSYNEIGALYTTIENDIAFAVRARAIIAGNTLFFVRVAVPLRGFGKLVDMQARIIDSFKLSNPSKQDIEKRRRFALLDALVLSYPESWKIRSPDFKDADRLSVSMRRIENNFVFGDIRVDAIRKNKDTDFGNEAKTLINRLAKRSIYLEKVIEPKTIDISDSFTPAETEIYETRAPVEMLSQEYWFTHFQSNTHLYFVTMLTPARHVSYDDWSRNRAIYMKMIAGVE